MVATFSLANPVFAHFAFYAMVVVLKMIAMSTLTSIRRMTSGAYGNDEDAKAFGSGSTSKDKLVTTNPGVERAKRNHLNDLENVPVFLIVGLFYVCIHPTLSTALWHFRIFAGSRILHTLAYQMGLQPWRALFYFAGSVATISMAVQVIMQAPY